MWPLAAFGGAYAWTLPPLYLLVGAAAIVVRPRIAAGPDRLLDAALIASLVAALLQLIPVAPAVRALLSPREAMLDSALRFDAGLRATRWLPLSVDPAATRTWLPLGAAAVLLFWVGRRWFTTSTVRRTARALAWIGLAAGPLVIVQRYSSPHLVYWTFRPIDVGSVTAGPFVNRNHMATWLLLALPTTVGYLFAHTSAHADGRRGLAGVVRAFEEPRTVWLIAAAVAMFAALITCQSRSAFIGLAGSLAVGVVLPQPAGRRVHLRAAALVVVAALGVAVALANTSALMERFERAGTDPIGGRLAIWHQTTGIVRDFPLTGVGIGSYETAMIAYQTQRQYGFFYNQAHDQYLQFAAEGGVLVGVPILLAIGAFTRAAWRALSHDRSPLFWLRLGSCAALVGVALQSIWETGLRMPANAVLCAAIAAIAVHHGTHHGH